MSRLAQEQWRYVVAAARESGRADCGHTISPRQDAVIWLRTERVGSVVEVWSVCLDCHDGNQNDYQTWGGRRPYRVRHEEIPG